MPDFHRWRGLYDRYSKEVKISDPAAFFAYWNKQEVDLGDEPNKELTLFEIERSLYECGRPYYKIWPEYLDSLCSTDLNVPAEYFKLPYDSFEIRLPKDTGLRDSLAPGDDFSIGTIHVSHLSRVAEARTDGGHATWERIWYQTHPDFPRGPNLRVYTLVLWSAAESEAESRYVRLLLCLVDGPTVEECVAGLFADDIAWQSQLAAFAPKALRLAFTLSALITGHDRLIEPDVLSADLEKFRQAKTVEEIARLHDKAARRRGEGRGYTVGKRERLLDLSRQRQEEYLATGKKLNFSHQRRGHLHGYHTKEGYIMKWIPMLTVRPELPPDPRPGRGVQVR